MSDYFIRSLVVRDRKKAALAVSRFQSAAGKFSLKDVFTLEQLDDLPVTDVILITTPDDAIESVAAQLAKAKQFNKKHLTVLHTSGALSSEILAPLARKGFHTGSIHPLVSINNPCAEEELRAGVFFAIEGDDRSRRVARQIARDLHGKSFVVKADQKALYHAAALTAAGQVTALFDLAVQLLAACGQTEPTARKLLLPLIESAVKNLKQAPPHAALTGTFARGDLATVEKHLQALTGERVPLDALEIYKLLGLRSLELADKKGLDRKRARRIKKLLASADSTDSTDSTDRLKTDSEANVMTKRLR
jgi:predicted short-subunit dehydrogenase-like oxidoreductase (DUF2520 family)